MRGLAVKVALVLMASTVSVPAWAQVDRQVRGFIGATFAGHSTFVDLTKEDAPSNPHVAIGAQAAWIWNVLGVEADFADTPGFFEGAGSHLITSSRVTTLTGNVVVAVPRSVAEYSLRLYFVGGGGIMLVRFNTGELPTPVYDISKGVPAVDFGFGALGLLTNKIGLAWELRRFQRVGGPPPLTGISFGGEELSYWRAHMAFVFRY